MISGLNAANAYSAARTAVAPQQGSEALARVGQAAEDFAAQMAQVDQVATGAMIGRPAPSSWSRPSPRPS